jgi:hypothetical protein
MGHIVASPDNAAHPDSLAEQPSGPGRDRRRPMSAAITFRMELANGSAADLRTFTTTELAARGARGRVREMSPAAR